MDENLATLDKIEREAWASIPDVLDSKSLTAITRDECLLRLLDILTRCRTLRISLEIEQRRREEADRRRMGADVDQKVG